MLDTGKNHFPKSMYTPVFKSKLFYYKRIGTHYPQKRLWIKRFENSIKT